MNRSILAVGDLHIDNWDDTLPNLYPCGKRSYCPIVWEQNDDQSIIVIAGDVSDDIDMTISYINNLTSFYSKVLFVDGNHESCLVYPQVLDEHTIAAKIHSSSVHFLSEKPFIVDRIAFVGRCGWWDYRNRDEEKDRLYFNDWMPHLSPSQVDLFHNNVEQKAKVDYLDLIKDIENMQRSEDVDRIILVTHTIPHRRFYGDDKHHHLNSRFESINSARYPKIDTWVFGHVHEQWDIEIDGIRYIANPRGRVEDYNRTKYKPVSLTTPE